MIAKEVRDKVREGTAYGNLGNACQSLGEFKRAKEYNEISLKIAREVGDKVREGVAYGSLGNVFHILGDFKSAIDYNKRSLEIAKEVGDKVREGAAYGNLGNVYQSLGEFQRAIEYNEISLKIAREVGDKVREGAAYGSLANVFHILGDFKSAIDYNKRSLKIAKEVGDKVREGAAYGSLGNVFLILGDFKSAMDYNERSLRIAKEVEDRVREGAAYGNFGNAYQSLGEFKHAKEYNEISLEIAEEVGDKVREGAAYGNLGNAYQSLGDFKRAIEYNKVSLKIAKELGQRVEEGQACFSLGQVLEFSGALSEALEYYRSSIKLFNDARGRLHSDVWKIAFRKARDYAYTALWRTLVRLQEPDEALCVAEQGRAQALKDLLEMQYASELTLPESSEAKAPISDMLGHIPTQTVFVAIESETINLWVVRKGRAIQFRQARVKGEDAVTVFSSLGEKFFLEESTYLRLWYNYIISPIADLIEGDELIIVPDGTLCLLPFAAFLDDQSKYLCETIRIRILPSLMILKLITECPEDYHRKSGVLLVGDPDVKFQEGKEHELPSLTFAREEVKVIGKMLGTVPLIGEDATKDEVLKRIGSVALVHIAAHSSNETGEIFLSPNPTRTSQKRPKDEDFMLKMSDVQAVGLRAKLVVLSCSHSAGGDVSAEGVVGIARAFLGAGAPSVLASLWEIEDEGTMEFMKDFYRHLLRGDSASVALNRAMKYLRESERYGDVWQWAPFVLLGDDVKIEFGEDQKEHSLPEIAPPPEILARGRLAVKAFNKALAQGKTSNKRVPIMLIGQDRSGKTSLKKSLKGQTFNPLEDSTVGIDADPSHFQVVSEVWKPGEKDQGVNSEAALSYEHHVARLTVANLRQERSVPSETAPESIQSESIFQGNTVLTGGSRDSTTASPSASNTLSAKSLSVSEDPKYSKMFKDPERGAGLPQMSEEKEDGGVKEEDTGSIQTSRDQEFDEDIHVSATHAGVAEDIAKLIEMLLREDGEVEDKEEIYSVLWDFAGQLVYYTTHALFLTTRAIYILVHDLSQNPHGKANPVRKRTMYGKFEDEFDLKSNLDYLDFWMSSVALIASQDKNAYNVSDSNSELLPEKLPPVLLVCTHADSPYGGGDPRTLAWEVFGSLRGRSHKAHLYDDVFVVDNTKSVPESGCPEVARLRKEILDLAKELPQLKEPIPIKWLSYEKKIQTMKDNGHKWIHLETAKKIASEVCQIVDNEEFKTLLDFLHDQRIVIHFNEPPELNKMVVLNPQWLIDVFKEVITVRPYNRKEKKVEHLWCKLENSGRLDEELLEHVWSPLFGNEEKSKETFENLITIMEKFSLLCPLPSCYASPRKQYLVPSMLKSLPPEGIRTLVASARIPSLFLRFDSAHVPPGLFPRLVLQFFRFLRFQSDKDKYMSLVGPQLFHNFARFFFSKDQNCSLVLLCHRSSIEVVVHNSSCSQRLAESQQSNLTMCENVNYETFDETCARRVLRELGFMLESMRKEFCWLKNMKYEVSFMCPICCQGGSAKCCQTHCAKGCKEEKCLHFWSEFELCNEMKTLHCTKSADAQNNSVEVKMFEPWLLPNGIQFLQLSASEHHGGKLACVDGAKQLTLPDVVEQSVLSLSCDAKEVVLQLKESLQLDQSSLEKPDSETKQLIRCLARKAKDSNRSDVLEHLREITPAGTTGPLLPENLDVRNIPVSKARELTIYLSGGDNWKEVAEGLGLTPQEIRFLDNRTLNPFEAVLSFVARQRYITVSELYDLLNKHGLPVVADIL